MEHGGFHVWGKGKPLEELEKELEKEKEKTIKLFFPIASNISRFSHAEMELKENSENHVEATCMATVLNTGASNEFQMPPLKPLVITK